MRGEDLRGLEDEGSGAAGKGLAGGFESVED